MKFDKPIVTLDFEATGSDPFKDRITEVGMIKLLPWSPTPEKLALLVNPDYPIHPDVVEMTGRTNESLLCCPKFDQVAGVVYDFVKDCDLAGFNLLRYDVPLLHTEFERCRVEWDLKGIRIIDAGNIYKKKEERTLKAAVKFYCGREFAENHQATADAEETLNVLRAQLERYPDLAEMNFDQLAEFSAFEKRVDIAGKLALNKDGEVVYNFGQRKDCRVIDAPDFAGWMLSRDFPTETKRILREILDASAKPPFVTRGDEVQKRLL